MESQKDILIIDDEVELTQMLQEFFESKGYKVIIACDGKEGVKKLKNIVPDLIILDLNMPGMGGIEFYKNICDGDSNPKYPIFVLTGRGETEKFFRGMDVVGFMAKPFKMSQLFHEINTVLEKRSSKG